MELAVQVSRWGNSLAVRLPAKLVDELGLNEGDEIEIVKATRKRLEVDRDERREKAVEGLRKLRGLVPTGYKFSRKDAYDDY